MSTKNPQFTQIYSQKSQNIRQRILSAKIMKIRHIQNQLYAANYQLTEVLKENQLLKTIQKRQDKALARYEEKNADLPKLVNSYEEEIAVLVQKNKTLTTECKKLKESLKRKENEVYSLQKQVNTFKTLDKDKHLLERKVLSNQLEEIKSKNSQAYEQINVLNRKLILDGKKTKHKMNVLHKKQIMCQKELLQALEANEILNDRLTQINCQKLYEPIITAKLMSKSITEEKLDYKQPVTALKITTIPNTIDNNTDHNIIDLKIIKQKNADSNHDVEDILPIKSDHITKTFKLNIYHDEENDQFDPKTNKVETVVLSTENKNYVKVNTEIEANSLHSSNNINLKPNPNDKLIKDGLLSEEKKFKLLSTLKAIDSNNSIDLLDVNDVTILNN